MINRPGHNNLHSSSFVIRVTGPEAEAWTRRFEENFKRAFEEADKRRAGIELNSGSLAVESEGVIKPVFEEDTPEELAA